MKDFNSDILNPSSWIWNLFAALAQLVEHPHGKGKVMGSCPIGGSSKDRNRSESSGFILVTREYYRWSSLGEYVHREW